MKMTARYDDLAIIVRERNLKLFLVSGLWGK